MLDQSGTKDGIYNKDGYIAINATAIQTGFINVGGNKENDYKDAKFFADVGSPEVYLAGWTVSTNSITTGDLGSSNSFHMYS
jgi:hypothetical protein